MQQVTWITFISTFTAARNDDFKHIPAGFLQSTQKATVNIARRVDDNV